MSKVLPVNNALIQLRQRRQMKSKNDTANEDEPVRTRAFKLEEMLRQPEPPFANPFAEDGGFGGLSGARRRDKRNGRKEESDDENDDEDNEEEDEESDDYRAGRASTSKSKSTAKSRSLNKKPTRTRPNGSSCSSKVQTRGKRGRSTGVITIGSSDEDENEEDGFEITEVRLNATPSKSTRSRRGDGQPKASGSGSANKSKAQVKPEPEVDSGFGRGRRSGNQRKHDLRDEQDDQDEDEVENRVEGEIKFVPLEEEDRFRIVTRGQKGGEKRQSQEAKEAGNARNAAGAGRARDIEQEQEVAPNEPRAEVGVAEAVRAIVAPEAAVEDMDVDLDNGIDHDNNNDEEEDDFWAHIPQELWDDARPAGPAAVSAPVPGPVAAPVPPQPARLLSMVDIPEIIPLVVSLIPDVCPDHLRGVIEGQIFRDPARQITAEDACGEILAHLFDTDLARYPKVKDKKRKAEDEAGPSAPKKRKPDEDDGVLDVDEIEYLVDGRVNYKSEKVKLDDRKGWAYRKSATKDLLNLFPLMTLKHITDNLNFHIGLYVPTYLDLAFQYTLPEDQRPWRAMKVPREVDLTKQENTKAKGKAAKKIDEGAAAFAEEKEFLIVENADTCSIEAVKILQPLEGDGDTECQCCFGDDHLVYMIQCRDGHFFCRDCFKRLLETALGDQKAPVHCMHESGCRAEFTERDVKKVLTPKVTNSYFALVQRKELEAAGLENLETCPSCEFAIVIDNEHEKLFTCQHPNCQVVSCRACKKPDHIPKTCAEAAAEDEHLNSRHTIEEAMTQALVRKCPKASCQKPFLKESGCNKITCTSCGTVSCYICRAIVTVGYAHFNQAGYGGNKANPCRLWDPVNAAELYQAEVAEARNQAQDQVINEAARLGRQIAQPDVEVALPQQNEVFRPAVIPGAYPAHAAAVVPPQLARPQPQAAPPAGGPGAAHLPVPRAAEGIGRAQFDAARRIYEGRILEEQQLRPGVPLAGPVVARIRAEYRARMEAIMRDMAVARGIAAPQAGAYVAANIDAVFREVARGIPEAHAAAAVRPPPPRAMAALQAQAQAQAQALAQAHAQAQALRNAPGNRVRFAPAAPAPPPAPVVAAPPPVPAPAYQGRLRGHR